MSRVGISKQSFNRRHNKTRFRMEGKADHGVTDSMTLA